MGSDSQKITKLNVAKEELPNCQVDNFLELNQTELSISS
jgi:hypothetical protein